MTKPVLAILYPPTQERPPRVVDQSRVIRAGANGTGKVCASCGAVTFGLSDRCGRCGR